MTADASSSTDNDASGIVSYMFDFGDGTIIGPRAGALATHTYVVAGDFNVAVTVSDAAGNITIATAAVRAVENRAPNARLSLAPAIGRTPLCG